MTQGSQRHATSVSNHPIRGLLDVRSISTTPREQLCTRAGREQANKVLGDRLVLNLPTWGTAQGMIGR